jgi:hypothetical protein
MCQLPRKEIQQSHRKGNNNQLLCAHPPRQSLEWERFQLVHTNSTLHAVPYYARLMSSTQHTPPKMHKPQQVQVQCQAPGPINLATTPKGAARERQASTTTATAAACPAGQAHQAQSGRCQLLLALLTQPAHTHQPHKSAARAHESCQRCFNNNVFCSLLPMKAASAASTTTSSAHCCP